MDPWKPVDLGEGQCAHWQVGPLDLWVCRHPSEWQVAGTLVPEEEERRTVALPIDPPADLTWRRWAAGTTDGTVAVGPVLPDRPVIVRPDSPLVIPPSREALFFVSIPLWIRVSVGTSKPITLCEERTVNLSNSWFGGPTEGELCYALKSRAKRTIEELSLRPFRAVCPLELRNRAKTPLEFQRLCLRVAHLGVYQGRRHLWTHAGRVVYQGEDQLSRVVYGRAAPPYDEAHRLVGAPRDDTQRGFLSKSFNEFVSLALP